MTTFTECPALDVPTEPTDMLVECGVDYSSSHSDLACKINEVAVAHNALVGVASPPALEPLLDDVDKLQDAVVKLQRDMVALTERVAILENS